MVLKIPMSKLAIFAPSICEQTPRGGNRYCMSPSTSYQDHFFSLQQRLSTVQKFNEKLKKQNAYIIFIPFVTILFNFDLVELEWNDDIQRL